MSAVLKDNTLWLKFFIFPVLMWTWDTPSIFRKMRGWRPLTWYSSSRENKKKREQERKKARDRLDSDANRQAVQQLWHDTGTMRRSRDRTFDPSRYTVWIFGQDGATLCTSKLDEFYCVESLRYNDHLERESIWRATNEVEMEAGHIREVILFDTISCETFIWPMDIPRIVDEGDEATITLPLARHNLGHEQRTGFSGDTLVLRLKCPRAINGPRDWDIGAVHQYTNGRLEGRYPHTIKETTYYENARRQNANTGQR